MIFSSCTFMDYYSLFFPLKAFFFPTYGNGTISILGTLRHGSRTNGNKNRTTYCWQCLLRQFLELEIVSQFLLDEWFSKCMKYVWKQRNQDTNICLGRPWNRRMVLLEDEVVFVVYEWLLWWMKFFLLNMIL
jgi:hypothetical protein